MVSLDLKVLIADDDEGMRLLLKKAVEKVPGFDIVSEAKDGEAALQLIEKRHPQVVFLDVEMPVLNGVECAQRIIDIDPAIFIIFVTAHEEYMPYAFEVYAFDYMIKPFKAERIIQTLDRIKELQHKKEQYTLKTIVRHDKGLDKLIIRNKEGISFVDMDDIILIQREDRNTAVYTSSERYITSDSLGELEEKLDKSTFFRTHKSYIVNLSMIHKIYPYGRWTYTIKLKNTEKDALLTSERYEELQNIFK